ncbi:hypothetical protein [Streptomyces noursei]|uniref:hypothetical protein n=1 Tax=Streptomyces noursei TaxID=1971 RepID=UPI00130E6857|nr:hypothetical protein [Streptomyces noursei]
MAVDTASGDASAAGSWGSAAPCPPAVPPAATAGPTDASRVVGASAAAARDRSMTRARARRPATAPSRSESTPRRPIDASSSARARSTLPLHRASTPRSWWKYASWATSPASRAASWPCRRLRSHALQCSAAANAGAAVRASSTAAAGWPFSRLPVSTAIAASTASDSAAARSGVTEGWPAHQA